MTYPRKIAVVQSGNPTVVEPISLTTAKAHLRIDPSNTSEDQYLGLLIKGVRESAEKATWRSLCKKQYTMYLDHFPHAHSHAWGTWQRNRVYVRPEELHHGSEIKLWYPPLISVSQITYIGLDGNAATLTPATDFQVDVASEPGRIRPLPQVFWPATEWRVENAVKIVYVAGYETGSAQIPSPDTGVVVEPETESLSSTPTPAEQVTSYVVDRTIPADLVWAMLQVLAHRYQNREPVIQGSVSDLPHGFAESFVRFSARDFAI